MLDIYTAYISDILTFKGYNLHNGFNIEEFLFSIVLTMFFQKLIFLLSLSKRIDIILKISD